MYIDPSSGGILFQILAVAIGVLSGLAAMVREQDALIMLLPGIDGLLLLVAALRAGDTRAALRTIGLDHEGAAALRGVVAATADRGMHHAQHRRPVFDQRHADAELAIALDELARAVERVDAPVARPGATPASGRESPPAA